ncbi:unnamed protein product [Owenia fusiformis]|uniref:Uncharacterized protein n=1 Tax=Owenia fusiformis TaxID=6347 RepID=A0A8J1XXJ3_OWEFU|nr:unnamed protein product [Owenia fusiformis]
MEEQQILGVRRSSRKSAKAYQAGRYKFSHSLEDTIQKVHVASKTVKKTTTLRPKLKHSVSEPYKHPISDSNISDNNTQLVHHQIPSDIEQFKDPSVDEAILADYDEAQSSKCYNSNPELSSAYSIDTLNENDRVKDQSDAAYINDASQLDTDDARHSEMEITTTNALDTHNEGDNSICNVNAHSDNMAQLHVVPQEESEEILRRSVSDPNEQNPSVDQNMENTCRIRISNYPDNTTTNNGEATNQVHEIDSGPSDIRVKFPQNQDEQIEVLTTQEGELVCVMPDVHNNQQILMNCPQGTPVLVLSNNLEKGTVEASVLIDRPDFAQLLAFQSGMPATLPELGILGGQAPSTPSQSVTQAKQKNTATKYYLCDIEGCNKGFTTMAYLKYHKVTHNGEKPLKCSYEDCNRTFAWHTHLRYHQLTHTQERLFHCLEPGCKRSFYTHQRLDVHSRVHTGYKPFICGETGCGKAFTTAGNLKNHRRIHSGERPYVCEHKSCNRRFCEQSSLKKHMLTHTGEKPYSCNICGKAFSQSGSRNTHVKAHRRQDVTKETNILDDNDLVINARGEIIQYQNGYHDTETSVLPHPVVDNFVTVVTQPPDGSSSDRQGNQKIVCGSLPPEGLLNSEERSNKISLIPGSNPGENVVVLTQPQEMVAMTTDYHDNQQNTQEMIVYNSDLLNAELNHEEINSNIDDQIQGENPNMTQSSGSQSEKNVVSMDPMMSDDDTEQSHIEEPHSPDKLTICE